MNKKSGGAYWIYGHHAVAAALANENRSILELYASSPEALPDKWRKKARFVPAKELDKKLPSGSVHQGIACLCEPLDQPSIEDIADYSRVAILDQVTDPQNVGAILRSAASFEIQAVILPKDNSPEENGAMAKSASGALESVPLIYITNLATTIEKLQQMNFWVVGLDTGGEFTINKLPNHDKRAYVLGAEGKGLRQLTSKKCDIIASIPMTDKIESLNVSNAACVVFYDDYINRLDKKPARK
jgi:23S rRNA (guanosine2251-2'-O)-methyltransferase